MPSDFDDRAHRRRFGENVRTQRRLRAWSQESLAEHAEMDRTYIVGIETGRRNPTLDVIVRLAIALDLSPSALLEGL